MKFLICMYMTYKAAVFLPRILMYFHSSWALNSQMRCFYHECKEMVQGGQKCNGQINWIHNDAYRPILVCTPLVIQQATLVRRFHLYSWHCHYQKLSQHYVGKKLLQRNRHFSHIKPVSFTFDNWQLYHRDIGEVPVPLAAVFTWQWITGAPWVFSATDIVNKSESYCSILSLPTSYDCYCFMVWEKLWRFIFRCNWKVTMQAACCPFLLLTASNRKSAQLVRSFMDCIFDFRTKERG